MSEGDNKEDKHIISRRDFLKLAGLTGAAGLLVGTGLGKLASNTLEKRDSSNIEPLALIPEIVDGVEVYGLKEKITSASTVDRFYAYLDDQFAKTNNIQIGNIREQRKELLSPNERYLEVTVRRSAYDSFSQKQTETGVSFPEWIKIHVDVMNRCMKEARPPFEMKAVLRRILVVDDNATKEFWNENAYRQGSPLGSALDCAWKRRFLPFSFDTDESWAIADDYRESGGVNFWEFRHENGKTIIGIPTGNVPFERYFEFPEENDSLSDKDNIKFDMGLVHEWSHYLLNLPDEYAQDVHDASQRFKDFTFGTESFHAPYISTYLAYLMRENIILNARNCYFRGDNRGGSGSFNERPREVEITAQFRKPELVSSRIEVRRVRLLDDDYYGRKMVPENADQVSKTDSLKFAEDLFQGESNCWLIRIVSGQTTREVFLPAAAFNMSKIAGLESAKYNLVFNGCDDIERTKQEVKLVEDADMDEFFKNSQDPPYAKMKVKGTDTWFVWFLRV